MPEIKKQTETIAVAIKASRTTVALVIIAIIAIVITIGIVMTHGEKREPAPKKPFGSFGSF